MMRKHPERTLSEPKRKSKDAADGVRLWLAPLFLALLALPCLHLTALGAQRVDLFHAAFVNACSGRTYQVHWQDARRYPQDFRYDFILSPVSLVVLEVWLEGAPTLSFSRVVPFRCWPRTQREGEGIACDERIRLSLEG